MSILTLAANGTDSPKHQNASFDYFREAVDDMEERINGVGSKFDSKVYDSFV